ncbi:MAG: hypothetical protein C0582_05390 [Alphaproteobacteria bacterium]|nr:MAG: hypothetical protein C0582_05390 [Alphaproteobacteria bacterium]
MTDVNSLMVGFFKALARGQETATIPNEKFNHSRTHPQQGEKKIFATAQYTVDTQKLLTLLTSLPVQKISPSDFTNFFLESILTSLDASYAQELPKNLQEGIKNSSRSLAETNLLGCKIKETGADFHVLFDPKKCTNLVYAFSHLYRLFIFAKDCQTNSSQPMTKARECLKTATKSFEKNPTYPPELKQPLGEISHQMNVETALRSFSKALENINPKGQFSSQFSSHSPAGRTTLQNSSMITFSIAGLVKHVRNAINQKLADDVALMKKYQAPRTHNQALKELDQQQASQAQASLTYISQKIKSGLSERMVCPSSQSDIYINRFACSLGDIALLNTLYDIVAFQPTCKEELNVQKSKLVSKCFTYFEQANESGFKSLSADQMKTLAQAHFSLFNFLKSYTNAVKTFSESFNVPIGFPEVQEITFTVKEVNEAIRKSQAHKATDPHNQRRAGAVFNALYQLILLKRSDLYNKKAPPAPKKRKKMGRFFPKKKQQSKAKKT